MNIIKTSKPITSIKFIIYYMVNENGRVINGI